MKVYGKIKTILCLPREWICLPRESRFDGDDNVPRKKSHRESGRSRIAKAYV